MLNTTMFPRALPSQPSEFLRAVSGNFVFPKALPSQGVLSGALGIIARTGPFESSNS